MVYSDAIAPAGPEVFDGVSAIDDKEGPIHLDDVEKNVDQAADRFGTVTILSDAERRLVRKLDRYIMPIIFAMFYLNKTDQNAIANARLNGLEADLGLVGVEFNTCVSILYVGYTLLQVPSNLLMSAGKVRPSLWMSCWMMAWAVVSAATGAVQSYSGLFAVRFLLGFAEAPFYPGAIYLLSVFYTRREIATRIAILYSANIFATAFAGLISAAVFASIDGAHGIQGWRWLFIILGIVTFGVAVVAIFLLPDHPLTTRSLTPDERKLAQDRMDRDTVGLEPSKGALSGFKQAVRDKRLWLFVPLQNLHLAACGFNSFFPTVVQTLGYSTNITLVLTCPPYLVAGLFSIGLSYFSGRYNERTWHISLGMIIARRRLRHGRLVTPDRHPLRLPLSVRGRSLLGQLDHPGLGVCDVRPNTREESSVAVDRQLHLDGELHLHTLSLSVDRWAAILDGHGSERGIFFGRLGFVLGDAGLATERE